jgi:hypothetical protein
MKRILILFVLVFMLAGCAPATSELAAPDTAACETAATSATCEPCADASSQPVLYGLWLDEWGDYFVFTEATVLRVEHDRTTETPYVRETYYEVQSIDWVNGVLTLMTKSVYTNGDSQGFDMPLHYMKVMIDGTSLWYSMGDESTGIPATADIGPFTRK